MAFFVPLRLMMGLEIMEKAIWKQATNLDFWQKYSPWYRQWMNHSHYHEGIVNFLTSVVTPKWRVLDIGAGNGVLSKPLARSGCEVTAMEPSPAMRILLREEMKREQAKAISVNRRSWEEASCEAFRDFDLILACNSLHLCPLGFRSALDKVFAASSKRVMVVTEFFSPEIRIPVRYKKYRLEYGRIERVNNSFAYHTIEEAMAHWAANQGRRPDVREREEIKQKLVQVGDHLWMEDSALVGLFFWRLKMDGSCA